MRRKVLIIVLLAAAGTVAGLTWWLTHRESATQTLALHGNVDLRQVELPFNNSERIAAVLVQEGDRVRRGQVLARLDTSRLGPQVAQAEAQAAAQRQIVARLHNGSRPEEIAQAEAQAAAQRQGVVRGRNRSRPEEIAQAPGDGEAGRGDPPQAPRQNAPINAASE